MVELKLGTRWSQSRLHPSTHPGGICMPTQFTGSEPETSSDGENTMFGATPVWERSRKKKGFGLGRKSAAPRTEAPRAADPIAAPPPAAEPRSFARDDYST